MWWNGRHQGLKIPCGQPRTGSSPVTGTTSEEACCVPLPRFSQEPGKLHIHRLLLPSPNRKSHGGLPIWFLYTVRIMYFLKRQKAVPPLWVTAFWYWRFQAQTGPGDGRAQGASPSAACGVESGHQQSPLVGDCFLVLAIPSANRPLRARLLPSLKGEVSPAQAPVTEGSPPVPRFIANQSDKRAVEGASPYDADGRFPSCHCEPVRQAGCRGRQPLRCSRTFPLVSLPRQFAMAGLRPVPRSGTDSNPSQKATP